MKRIKNCIVFLGLLICGLQSFAQDFEKNLQKYWFYRERLKNFVVQGDGVGCSNISNSIDPPGILNYSDHTQVLGNYIGMLAMEHYLLRTYAQPQDISENTKELFYALEAINRLDKTAETYWCLHKFGVGGGTWNATGYVPNFQQDLNGFFIRDETPYNLLDYNYDGMSMENHLGDHWAPFADGLRKMKMAGSYTNREYYTLSSTPAVSEGGPAEMSLDQVIELTGGLILVAKFVDPALTYPGHQFSDHETSFKQEVKNICDRISERCKAHNWTIKNPVTGQCVRALDYLSNSCQDGGAKFGALSAGYAASNSMIEDDFQTQGTYWNTHYNGQVNYPALWLPIPNSFFTNPPPLNHYEDTKVLMLAAMSDIWGINTLPTITDRCYRIYNDATINFPHYPLLNCVLYNKTSIIPNNVYECMLNSADPEGQTSYRFNYEWNDQRLLYGANKEHRNYSSERWGEYMYYFNMYCIYNPAYMNGQYRKINALQLCQNEITKTGYTEWDWKKFAAVDQITSGDINNQGKYVIKQYDGDQGSGPSSTMCDKAKIGNYVPFIPDPLYPGNSSSSLGEPLCNYDQIERNDPTKVTFLAGNQISLQPGFEVFFGAELDAYTQDNLQEYQRTQSQSCVPCSNCKLLGNENINGFSNDYADHRFYKVFQFVPGELLVVTPHVIFKVEENGAVGENMCGINIDGSSNCPSTYMINNDGATYVLKGYQRFRDGGFGDHEIVDVDFYKGYTFVSFADGRILRVRGTGGTGRYMFGVDDDNLGFNFQLVSGSNNYEQAWFDFKHHIFEAMVIDNDFLVCFNRDNIGGLGENSHIYKFNTIGSSPYQNSAGSFPIIYNFWNVDEHDLSTIYGSEYFMGKISCIAYLNEQLFVATKNNGSAKGKLLKIHHAGGSGQHMFGVEEFGNGSSFAFANNTSGTVYYIGDEKFDGGGGGNAGSYVTAMFFFNNETYVGFKNGKAFRLSGTGGTGHLMFNIDEYNNGFVNHDNSSTHYLQSFQDYSPGSGNTSNESYISQMETVGQYLLVGLHDGRLFKYDVLSSVSYNGQIAGEIGNSDFKTSIVSLSKIVHGCPGGEDPNDPRYNDREASGDQDHDCYCYSSFFIGLADYQIIACKNSGGTGENFYGLVWHDGDKPGYVAKCGYQYFRGSQNFKEVCAGARLEETGASPRGPRSVLSEDDYLAIAENHSLADQYDYSYFYEVEAWPNPSNGELNIRIKSPRNDRVRASVVDIIGKTVAELELETNTDQNIQLKVKAGVYYLIVNTDNTNFTINKKIIVQ